MEAAISDDRQAGIVWQMFLGYAPITKIRLSTKLLQGLGWNPKTNLFDMFDKIIKKLKTNRQ